MGEFLKGNFHYQEEQASRSYTICRALQLDKGEMKLPRELSMCFVVFRINGKLFVRLARPLGLRSGPCDFQAKLVIVEKDE